MTTQLYSVEVDGRDQLNAELGGGIPTGSIVLLEGEFGAGKSAIAQRFTYGFCENDTTVTYLSTELSLRGFIEQMDSLEYNVEDHILDSNLLFLSAELDSGSRLQSNVVGDRKDLLNRLMNATTMWNADIIVIDTFDAILRNDSQFEALIRQNDERQGALEIISFFRSVVSGNQTIILTVDPSTVDDETIGPFRAIADVFIELDMIQVGNNVRRQMSIKRYAGMGEQVGDLIGYSVRDGTGIVIENRTVA